MITHPDTPPARLELLEPLPPTPAQIALHVTVQGHEGRRQFWMTEGGALFFTRLDGSLNRATAVQARRIMHGIDLARRSPSFTVQGRTAAASELDAARGLSIA